MLSACTGDENISTEPADQARMFPQGVASGDPKPSSVVLWTRVEAAGAAAVTVDFEVASDDSFNTIVVSGQSDATADSDHTIRLLVTGLNPYTHYYYRFTATDAQGLTVQGVIGRTKTAPSEEQDVAVRFAYASCQDFNGRYYHAWEALAAEPDIDFVLFLGDYVYETEGNPTFQDPTAERHITVPDGLTLGSGKNTFNAAVTLADYRSLYKQYRSDKHLQRVHQMFPFVLIWDDHEFANDCWQDHSTDFDEAKGDEKSPDRRRAATQAWFEYQPADVDYNPDAGFPNDIRVYRSLRFGKHVHIVLTDQRYYRDDHLIPEGPADPDVAKLFENSSLGSRSFVLKSGFDLKEAAAKPTMLGAQQKQWLIDEINGSNATWKVWGSETQLSQMAADLSSFKNLPASYQDLFYITTDQWDGYRSERADILNAIGGSDNVIVLVGDIHAFYASELYPDFDAPAATPAAIEYVVAGISSSPMQESVQRAVDGNKTLSSLGLGGLVEKFDEILTDTSAHYKYAASDATGVAIATVSATAFEVEFLLIDDIKTPTWNGNVTRKKFRTAAGVKAIELVS
ncbi:MAG TPA: alkaline phosphatase [Sorangium sp.]|nr:alkaline phosphatase [Sorangium sp.]